MIYSYLLTVVYVCGNMSGSQLGGPPSLFWKYQLNCASHSQKALKCDGDVFRETFYHQQKAGPQSISHLEYINLYNYILCNVHKCQLPLIIKMTPSYRLFQQPAPAPNNQIPAGHVHGASLTAACSCLSWGGNAMMASIEAILNQPEIYIVIKFPTVENTPCTLT